MNKMFSRGFVTACLMLLAGTVQATLLDFNSLATSSSGGISAGSSIVENGYQLTTYAASNPSYPYFYAFQDGWQSNRASGNGTTTLMQYSTSSGANIPFFSLSAVGGGGFIMNSIDLGQLFRPSDFAFSAAATNYTFTGYVSGGGTVTTSFTKSTNDFETFNFSSAWANLISVDVSAFSGWNNSSGTYTNFDNIVVNAANPVAAVPEPETYAMLLAGLGLLGFTARRRKNSSA